MYMTARPPSVRCAQSVKRVVSGGDGVRARPTRRPKGEFQPEGHTLVVQEDEVADTEGGLGGLSGSDDSVS